MLSGAAKNRCFWAVSWTEWALRITPERNEIPFFRDFVVILWKHLPFLPCKNSLFHPRYQLPFDGHTKHRFRARGCWCDQVNKRFNWRSVLHENSSPEYTVIFTWDSKVIFSGEGFFKRRYARGFKLILLKFIFLCVFLQLDDAAVQVYKDGDYGAYLDLESSLAEQSEDIDGLQSG